MKKRYPAIRNYTSKDTLSNETAYSRGETRCNVPPEQSCMGEF